MFDKVESQQGVLKLTKALVNLELAKENLIHARRFPIYTQEGMDASRKEIHSIGDLLTELRARIYNLTGD